MSEVWRKTAFLAALACLTIVLAGAIGAGPGQDIAPPQPFFNDIFFGHATVQGAQAPNGTTLVACIDDCDSVFQTAPVEIGEGGSYSNLRVDPADKRLVGHAVTFYLVNEYGRIRAAETADFKGVLQIQALDLSFADAMPKPTPTPTMTPAPTVTPTASLPVPGDPGVTAIPKLALAMGAAAAAAGILLLLVVRRRVQ